MMTEFLASLNPGLILILAGLAAFGLRDANIRGLLTIAAPLAGLLAMTLRPGDAEPVTIAVLGQELILYHIDPLSRIFGLAFLIAALLCGIYSLRQTDPVQDATGLIYAGAAIAATFCGDFLTLFILFEITAISSVWLIFARRTKAAYASGLRYLCFQILSGVLLLSGTAIRIVETGSATMPVFHPGMDSIALDVTNIGNLLILLALGIKAAFPLMHNWLQDAYPNATHTGTVALSAFTTKLAVYVLARCFAGLDWLVWIGAIMTVFPVFFAVIENDLRKVLSYSLNNQVGFMVCAIGVGGSLAINGAALHAFVHIIYKALLFMSMGAVMLRTGTTKATELGGLSRTMPATTLFCLVGAASISAFPLFSGYVAKAFTMSAVAGAHLAPIWFMLLFASAGVLEHSGIKIPYCAFFGKDRGLRPKEAPINMLLAMGLAAILCVSIGVFPALLYSLAPYREVAMSYLARDLWTTEHIVTQLELLVFAALAFCLLKRLGLYPTETNNIVLDSDWLWRKLLATLARWAARILERTSFMLNNMLSFRLELTRQQLAIWLSPQARWRYGTATDISFWVVAVLGLALMLMLQMSGKL